MKVFWMEAEACLLANMVWMGMCDEIGPENVIQWPAKDWYHDPNVIRYMRVQPKRDLTSEQADEEFRSADIVVLAGPREENTKLLASMIARLGRPKRLVVLDGEDYTQVHWPVCELLQPTVYLKLSSVPTPFAGVWQDEKRRMESRTRVQPFALATPLSNVEPRDKTIDVSLLGGNAWHRGRVEGRDLTVPWSTPVLVARLQKEFGDKFVYGSASKQGIPYFVPGHPTHVQYDEYIYTVSRSKISVVVGGHGVEPLRTVEVMSCPGTLCARQNIQVISPWPFVDGRTVVGWDEMDPQWDGLVKTLEFYLAHDDLREVIARRGNAYMRGHFQQRHRARDLIEAAFG